MARQTMSLLHEIRQLLAAPESGAGAPGLARVEHTLTSGYARALELEAERDRIERRLDETAAADARERERLTQRLGDARRELSRLRAQLEPLRARAKELRGRGYAPTADAVLDSQ